MAESLTHIAQPVKHDLEQFEDFYRESLQSDVPLLKTVIQHVFQQKGKQLRPLLIFLSAAMNGTINRKTQVAAVAIEMLHTATLVHDDVVDNADERRGMKSVNALWRSKVAVLVGDYFFAQGLWLTSENNANDLLDIITLPIKKMSEGELLQIEKSRLLDTTEEAYFQIINKKTAVLLGACTAVGAYSAGANAETTERMRRVGEAMGMAFQIKDDIFDYQKTNLIGKPTGNDIIERKITLPLIYALLQVDTKERKRILDLVANAEKNKKNVEIVRNFVITHKGLDYAAQVAARYKNEAITLLEQFADTPVRTSMIALAHYIIERNK